MKVYKILVVDDDIENLKIVISILEKHHPDYIIYQADSGKIALELIDRYKPDIILSDWEMPELNGIELLRIMKENIVTRHIPVIIISGVMVSSENLKIALEAGAIDFVTKPINTTEMLARIHTAITISDFHKKILQEKEQKIIDNILFINEVNRFFLKIVTKINYVKSRLSVENEVERECLEIFDFIKERTSFDIWNKSNRAYRNLHPNFRKRLLNLHPNLTPTELDLSSMIKLGLSVKELADIMFVTPESMKVFRSRLRKKLGLQPNQNLQIYLSSI